MRGFSKKGSYKILTVIYIFIIGVFTCTMTLSCAENLETPGGSSETVENDDLNNAVINNNNSGTDPDETGSGESDNENLPDDEVDETIINDDSGTLIGEEAEEDVAGEENAEEEIQTDGEEIRNEVENSEQTGDEEIDFSSSDNFRIDVDLSAQKVFIFYKDNPIREMICSGGTEEKPTPPGEFTTTQRGYSFYNEKYKMGAYYWIRFYYDYLFHSVPFDENHEFIQEEIDKLGTPASHGCIRLKLDEVKWMYDMLPLGIKVRIY
ncbi:MAG: L,D-transpeptidase family protein [Actinomycetota bacterium]